MSDFGRFSDDFRRISNKTNCSRKLVKTAERKTFQSHALRVSFCHQCPGSHVPPQCQGNFRYQSSPSFLPRNFISSVARTIFGEFRAIDRFSDRDNEPETVQNPRVKFLCRQDSYYAGQLIPATVVVRPLKKCEFVIIFCSF